MHRQRCLDACMADIGILWDVGTCSVPHAAASSVGPTRPSDDERFSSQTISQAPADPADDHAMDVEH